MGINLNLQQFEFKPKIDYKTNRSSPNRWLLSHISRHKKFLIIFVICQLISSYAQSSVPGLIGKLVGLFTRNQLNIDNLNHYSLLILILLLGSAVLNFFRISSMEFVSQRIERDTRDELYSSLLGKSLTFHDKQKIGDLMSRAATDVRQLNLLMNPGINLVFAAIVGVIMPLIFIALINIKLLLVPVIFFVIFMFTLRWYNNQLAPYSFKSRTSNATINSRLNEVIVGMQVVRGASQEDNEREVFYDNIKDFRNIQVKLGSIQARYYPILIFSMAIAAAIFHGIILLNAGEITIDQLIAFILLINLLRFPVFINIFAFSVITLGTAAARRILDMINGESEINLNPSGYNKKIQGKITFNNVSFSYSNVRKASNVYSNAKLQQGNGNTLVLRNISFEVNPGQTVALVGITGSGKTTITKLLSRLYDPIEGEIAIDGVSLQNWSIESLRNQMALVEQDVFLFSRTIKENISFGLQDLSEEEIIEAAKLANAHNFIMQLPEGYDTKIGERGTTLSGGQRQRIAIARAVVRNPRILILDDASSAIDSKTEDEINQAIRNVLKGRVAFIITHRIAQIRKADLIILMDQGRIIDKGTHEYLLKNSDRYKEIFSIFDTEVKS